MVKFILGLVTGVILVFLSFVLLFFVLIRFREKPPEISANSVLVLRLSGDIPEKAPVTLPDFLGGSSPSLTVVNVYSVLRKAASDSNIRALVLEPDSISAGWGKLEEIRSDIEQFRKSGKPVFAYLRQPTTREYYISLPADRIFLGDEEPVMIKGLRAETMYFKRTLDKLGVSVEVEHDGKYKDFGDMFTRTDMSPETREVITGLVDDLYGNMVARIAAARKKTPDDVRAIIDQGPFTATQALKAGLVDELRFEDQMWGELKDKLGATVHRVGADKYVSVADSSASGSHIALVVASGDIVRGDPGDDGSEATTLTSFGFNHLLREVGGDSNIRGVIVRIDSGGGEATASDEMWRQMNLLSKQKPLVISMSDLAASGGYYMAMTGDPVVAYPQTETGSIGVVFGKPDLHGLYDKLGVTKDAVQRGKHADIDSDYTELTPEERQLLRNGIDENYRDFVSKVAAARHRQYDQIEPVAQGRVWLGAQAKDRGLVDELGGLDTAIAAVKKKANIPANENVALMVYPPRQSLFTMLTKRSQPDVLEAARDAKLSEVFGKVPYHAWIKGGMLRTLPLWFTIR
ncbi:MAG TPA: signal peptide peptidase SppA [Bryobacteraceae bacterium]|nr:signal peptide peptidase SppA [Bryobacteraceae bacterium]